MWALVGLILLLAVHCQVLQGVHARKNLLQVQVSAARQRHHEIRTMYLDLMRVSLTGSLLRTPAYQPGLGLTANLVQVPYSAPARQLGKDWPVFGLTMVGDLRLRNIQELLTNVIENQVEGDYVECGVWRGGASVFARAVLKSYHAPRTVHVVDSFQGLPTATSKEDDDSWSKGEYLRVSLAQVQEAFTAVNLLDSQVEFHQGYFRYALPVLRRSMQAGGKKFAVLRMDGDMYESTMDQLFLLYDLVAVNGFVIIDDFSIPVCQKAVREFFTIHNVTENISYEKIDNNAAYFKKTQQLVVNMDWYLNFNSSRSIEA